MTNPSTHQNVWFSFGNTTLLKSRRNHGLDERSKIWIYSLKNEGLWKSVIDKKKRGTPKRLVKPVVFEENSMMMLQDKKGAPSKSLWNQSFLHEFDDNEAQKEVPHYEILIMAAATARLWGTRDEGPKCRTKQFWAWLQPQQDFEVQAMKEESRFWTALQFGWKVPTSSLEGKADTPQWISRLRARTPCCKQLFGE